MESENTAFLPSWNPINAYDTGLLNSSYSIVYNPSLTIFSTDRNFENFDVLKTENSGQITYEVKNMNPIEDEPLSPMLKEIMPNAQLASSQFYVEGIEGSASNWKELGKWEYDNLYQHVGQLSETAKQKARDLVKNTEDPIEKAKIIYDFMQDKTRYISVQVGIGGLKPMLANDVDRLGYGDCKALTNYTKSLLDAVGVESYFTELYGGSEKLDMDFNLPRIQGNHVILNLPTQNGDVWLECTSQKVPFGHIASFTDDRQVIVVTPEGGVLKKTSLYTAEGNLQVTKGKLLVHKNGEIEASVLIESKGTQYNDNLDAYDGKTPKELETAFKSYFKNINNISFSTIEVVNNKSESKFEEKIEFTASNYASFSGENGLIAINAFNYNSYVPKRVRNRKLPFEIARGYVDIDEVEITLSNAFEVIHIPQKSEIISEFGSFSMELEKINETTYMYKRKLQINAGKYNKEAYEVYREFRNNIKTIDNSKIIVKIKNNE